MLLKCSFLKTHKKFSPFYEISLYFMGLYACTSYDHPFMPSASVCLCQNPRTQSLFGMMEFDIIVLTLSFNCRKALNLWFSVLYTEIVETTCLRVSYLSSFPCRVQITSRLISTFIASATYREKVLNLLENVWKMGFSIWGLPSR